MPRRSVGLSILLTLTIPAGLVSALAAAKEPARSFAVGNADFLLDGKPFQIRCGEMHAPRIPREYWQHRLKMCKAMGLNAVCAYLFWNMHEPRPGQFEWSGQADAAEFCRLAQREGLWVILRPGPYACAEWEMGGLPWWLLKTEGLKVRSRDPKFLEPAKAWLKEVGRMLAPLQVNRGGPIIMVQVENEYGSFGKDAVYMGDVRQALIDAGFTVPLFACNPPQDLQKAARKDIFNVVNFGSEPAAAFAKLREVQPSGPLMCGEFYPSWFDTWGIEHHHKDGRNFHRDLEHMLAHNVSFSIYMAHGGTTFGLWSGADRPFKPDTSSYDYDAPISEAGWTTDKFRAVRKAIAGHLPPGETLPEPPPANPVIAVPKFPLAECAPMLENLPGPVADRKPRTMEAYDQAHGCILYRTLLPGGPAGYLEAKEVHDFGWVSLDGKPIGVLDRRGPRYRVALPTLEKPARLEILVEAMGRVNFGPELWDHKGLLAPVKVTRDGAASELEDWQVFRLPLDDAMLKALRYSNVAAQGPAFHRGFFQVDAPGDTFLDMRSWGKGVAWVNGHCLGRFWNIGPTQTMYLPGPWLKAGRNEVVVFDLLGPASADTAGLTRPILDQLRPELDFAAKQSVSGIPAKIAAGLPLQQTAVRPAEFTVVSPGRVFVDFGRAAFAGLELRFPKAENGRNLTIRLGEKRSAEKAVDGKPGGSVRYHEARIMLKAGQEKYLVPLAAKDARRMPPEIGAVMPFRYVEIENAPPSFAREHVTQLMAHYPFDDRAADFRSSDDKLNAIWELCKYSMKATSFCGIFVDGDRERIPYEADAFINQLGWYYTAGDYTLPRHTHEYLIGHPTWPTEWILFSVLIAWEDYLYSGDAVSLRNLYKDLEAKTLLALARPDGLISVPPGGLPGDLARAIHTKSIRDVVDWPGGERDGYDMRPVNTVVNAFHARALDRMACIAAALGKPHDEARYREAAQRVARTINEKLFDRAYIDGEGSRHSSLHANMFPLAFGLAPPERRERVTEFVRSRGMACSVYGAQFLMDALFDAGAVEHAIALMTASGDRSWTHMIEGVGTTITLEAWDTKYKNNQDWNHAWGAAPANLLPRKLLGIEPLAPGWTRLQIYPRLGKLKWAEARTPTPRGAVFARAEAGQEYRLALTVPAGSTAVVFLPAKSAETVTESGLPLAAKGAKLLGLQNGRAELEVAAGSYKFSSRM
jgi:beta-galactosidase